jgi:DNA-binding HxlR family transcriptional regulator
METTEDKIPYGSSEDLALKDTMYAIGGKWKIRIIKSVCVGNNHFSDIERSIPGITKRMLSRELKELETNQIITRKVYPDMPSKAEYRFTDYAKTLIPLVNEMVRWGREHRKVIANR